MKKFYSPGTRGFYPEDMLEDYRAAGTLPEDLQEVDEAVESIIRAQIDHGNVPTFNGGTWTFPAAAPEPIETVRVRALAEVRRQRVPILNTLDGIAGRMHRASLNMSLSAKERSDAAAAAAAADTAADAMRDITALPAMLAATDYAGIKTAIMARYKAIAKDSPAVVRTAFVEVLAS